MPDTPADLQDFVLLDLAGTTYGVHSRFVQHVSMVENITPVPNATPALDGVVFSRGQVIPAVSLRARFGFARIPYDLRTRLVVIHAGGRVVGLIADTAREFTKISAAAIKPPPEAIANLSGDYIEGIATVGERLIIILNLDEVIQIDDQPASGNQDELLNSVTA